MQTATACAYFFARRYAEASLWAEKALRERSDYLLAICISAASDALVGRLDRAQKTMVRLRQLNPALCVSNLKDLYPVRRPEDFARWAEGRRKAGLPE